MFHKHMSSCDRPENGNTDRHEDIAKVKVFVADLKMDALTNIKALQKIKTCDRQMDIMTDIKKLHRFKFCERRMDILTDK